MNKEFRLSIFFALTTFMVTTPRLALARDADVIALLDGLCIATQGELAVVEKMVKAIGGREIPQNTITADQAIARNGGKGFLISRNNEKFMVGITANGACSILAKNGNRKAIQEMLEKNYSLSTRQETSFGPQVITTWNMREPKSFAGSKIALISAKPGYGADGAISVGYIPPQATK